MQHIVPRFAIYDVVALAAVRHIIVIAAITASLPPAAKSRASPSPAKKKSSLSLPTIYLHHCRDSLAAATAAARHCLAHTLSGISRLQQ